MNEINYTSYRDQTNLLYHNIKDSNSPDYSTFQQPFPQGNIIYLFVLGKTIIIYI